jgi:IclR family transcriptional regulator, acetate operon repressor
MQTVDKAMSLLAHFGPSQPEIGLSELARMADFDKAATRRFLVALANHGFIEQNHENNKYRLGSAFLRLAHIREATRPFASIVQPILNALANDSGETAHVSMLAGNTLSTVAIAEPRRATRATVDMSEPLPLYATASGFCCLAFAETAFAENYIVQIQLKKVATKTVTSKKALRDSVQKTFQRGIGRAEQSFENDVIGTAAPIFNWAQHAVGAVAIAAVASRYNTELKHQIDCHVVRAAIDITQATGGDVHANLHRAFTRLNP